MKIYKSFNITRLTSMIELILTKIVVQLIYIYIYMIWYDMIWYNFWKHNLKNQNYFLKLKKKKTQLNIWFGLLD